MSTRHKFLCLLLFSLLIASSYQATSHKSSALEAGVITVNTVADDLTNNGNCTLREAIQAANTNTAVDHCPAGTKTIEPDTIVFATNGLFALTHPNGALLVDSSLILEGNGQNKTILDGIHTHQLFYLYNVYGSVTLRHLTLQNGYDDMPTSDGAGGAIFSIWTDLILEDVLVQDSSVVGAGGGGIGAGGDSLTLINSIVRNNSADGTYAGGGGIVVENSHLTIQDSVVSGNTADLSVGGGLVALSSVLTITHSLVAGNTAVSGLGGGGIYVQGSSGVIEYSTFHHNSADGSSEGGGGLLIDNNSYRPFYIHSSTISANSANSSLKGGGGLMVSGEGITVWNSTISANTADNSGQGGAGILTDTTAGLSDFIYTTIAYNRALNANGGGVYPQGSNGIVLANSIVAYNIPNDCYNDTLIISAEYNLDGDNSCTLDGPGDLPATDPLLGSLQINGGTTETHALPENSPAVDAATCLGYNISTDQRGIPRPFGSTCDIGAFEFSLPKLYLPLVVK